VKLASAETEPVDSGPTSMPEVQVPEGHVHDARTEGTKFCCRGDWRPWVAVDAYSVPNAVLPRRVETRRRLLATLRTFLEAKNTWCRVARRG